MENDVLSGEADENKKHIHSLLTELQQSLENQNEIINKFKQARKEQCKEMSKKDDQIQELKCKLVTCTSKLKDKPEDKSQISGDSCSRDCHKCKELGRKLETVQEECQAIKAMNEQYKIEIKSTKEQLIKSHEEHHHLERNMSKLNIENSDLVVEVNKLNHAITVLNASHGNLQTCVQEKQREIDDLKRELDEWRKKERSTVRVQMYAAVNRELCDRMMSELEAMLTTQLEMYDTVLQIEKYKDAPPDSHLPLLVLCINASRLGTDVNQALRDVNRSRTFALVVLHHKDIHALPRQPSEKLLIGSEYKDINLIVDIAYLTTKGIYPCEMNNISLDKLYSFIKSNT